MRKTIFFILAFIAKNCPNYHYCNAQCVQCMYNYTLYNRNYNIQSQIAIMYYNLYYYNYRSTTRSYLDILTTLKKRDICMPIYGHALLMKAMTTFSTVIPKPRRRQNRNDFKIGIAGYLIRGRMRASYMSTRYT